MANNFTEKLQQSIKNTMENSVARISSNVSNRASTTITELTNNVINKSITGANNTISSLFTSDTTKTSAAVLQNKTAPSVKITTVSQLPAGLESKVTDVTNMAGSIATSALSEVQGASSRILTSVAQTTSSAISNTVQSSLSSSSSSSGSSSVSSLGNKLTNSLKNQVSNATNNVTSLASSRVNNLVSGAISGVSSNVSNSLSNMFGSISASASALMNKIPASEKGSAEVNSKVTALAADSAEALSKPVAFVQKSLKDTVTGATTSAGSIADSLGDLASGALDKLKEAAGDLINSVADVNNFLSAAAEEFAKLFGGDIDIRDLLFGNDSSDTKVVSRSVSVNSNSDSSPAAAVGAINKNLGAFFDSLMSTEGFNEANAASLTDTQLDYLSSQDTAYVDEVLARATSDYQKESSNLQDTLAYLEPSEVQSIHGELGSSSAYPKLSSTTGADLSDIYGNTDLSTVQQMYATAHELFPTITPPSADEVTSRRDDKTVYDALMSAAMNRRCFDLGTQLKTLGQQNGMYDNRTRSVVAKQQQTAAKRGKIRDLSVSIDVAGAASVRDPQKVLVQAAANMTPNEANFTAFTLAASKLNIPVDEVFKTEVAGTKVFDSSLTTIAAANGNESLDRIIGSDNRKLIESARLLYNLNA